MKTHIYNWYGDVNPDFSKHEEPVILENTECTPVEPLSARIVRMIVREEIACAANINLNNERAIELQREVIVRRGRLLADIFNSEIGQDLPVEIKRRIDSEMLQSATKIEGAREIDAIRAQLDRGDPVYCTVTDDGTYQHSKEFVPNADCFVLYSKPNVGL